jgi:hypothetical protein
LAEAAVLRAAEGSRAHVQWGPTGASAEPEPVSSDERAAITETIEAIVDALTEAKLGPDVDAHSSSAR